MTTELPDVSVWFALSVNNHSHHGCAMDWLSTASHRGSVAFNRATQQGLLRLLSTKVIMQAYGKAPLVNGDAWKLQQTWMTDDRIGQFEEPPEMDAQWKAFGAIRTASPKLWMHAYLAAFAMAGNYRLVTTDKAFKQFKGLDLAVLS